MSSLTASSSEATDMSWIASTTEPSRAPTTPATATVDIVLSPEDIQKAQARANILYRPTSTPAVATTTPVGAPQVVLIATTTRATGSGVR